MTTNTELILGRRPIDQRVSVHESGHAVVAIARGLPVDHITLRVDLARGSLGSMFWRDSTAPMRVWDGVIALLAGGEAERRALGFITAGGDRGDIAGAREGLALALSVAPSAVLVDEALDICRGEAADDVERLWPWITVVAAALRSRRVLDAATITQLRPAGCGDLMKGTPP